MTQGKLGGLMRDLAHASGVGLRGPFRKSVDFGGFENQRKTYQQATFEAMNEHEEWEILWGGPERDAAKLLQAAKRLFDIGKGQQV